MKRPSFQFYPGDWLNDAALRMCSTSARGLWIDMICIMHQGTDYGYLKVNHKVILTANLARMVGSTLPEVEGWLAELEGAGVFSRDASGCVFSRRMIKDEELRNIRAKGGKLGGNPVLMSAKTPQPKVNLDANLPLTPSSSSSSSSSSDAEREPHFPEVIGRPTLTEVKAWAGNCGLASWKAEDWWNEMQGCGWLDHQSRPVVNWQAVLSRVKTKWESDGRPKSPPVQRQVNQKPSSGKAIAV